MLSNLPQRQANNDEAYQDLYDYVSMLRREIDDTLYNLDSDNISELNASIIRTAIKGARIELQFNGITSYNDLNQLHGLCYNPSSPNAEFLLYYNDVEYFNIKYYDIGLRLAAFQHDILYYHMTLNEVWTSGVWDCSASAFVELNDGVNPYVTTAYAAHKGSLTSGDSHRHTVTVDGVEYHTSYESHSHAQN